MSFDIIEPRRIADQNTWLGITNEPAHLLQRIGGIERMENQPCPQRTEVEPQIGHGLLYLHAHPITRGQPQIGQRPRNASALAQHIRVGDRATFRCLKQDARRILCGAPLKSREKVFRAHDRPQTHNPPMVL